MAELNGLKGIWYGRGPEVIYLQLTKFQSLIAVLPRH